VLQQTVCQIKNKNFLDFLVDSADDSGIIREEKRREKEMKMNKTIETNLHNDFLYIITSDCCGAEMDGIQQDHEICPSCGEHCELDGFWSKG
jgi:hypothetical protein